MLSTDILLKMFAFDHHTNNRLLDLSAKLTPEQWDAPQDLGRRTSLHETLFHVLIVSEEWVYFCQHGTSRFNFRKIEFYPDVVSLRTFSDESYQATRAYIETLDEDTLASIVTGNMAEPDGPDRSLPVWYILSHALFHSAQHRSEAAAMLTKADLSPGFVDFMGHDW